MGVLVVLGALHLSAVMLLPSARTYLSPRFTLVIAAVFLGLIAIGTMSTALLAMLLCVVPTVQLGSISVAGIVFNPTLILGSLLSSGLLLRLSIEHVIPRREWTATGRISLAAVIAATAAVVFSSIGNSQSLLKSTAWFVAFGVAVAFILSARFGYLRASTIPVALLIGFAISATSDVRYLLQGKTVDVTGYNAGRFNGGLGDYELLGEFYLVGTLIALATMVYVRRLAITLLALYVLGLGSILVFATHNRSTLILLSVGGALILISPFIVGTSSISGRSRAAFGIVVAAFLGAVLAPLISSSRAVARLLSTSDNGDLARMANRSGVWSYVATDSKFLSAGLFGNGPVGIYEWFGEVWPHNLVLWTIWSLGIIGCIFIALLAATGISGIVQRPKHGWVTAVLGFSLTLVLIDETVIEFPRKGSMILFVIALCALVGASSISERSELLGRLAE